MRLELRPHQLEAVQAGAAELAVSARASVVMACASGKTLVGLRLAETAERVVFFEPSLPLIRQTLGVARQDGILDGRRVICVCSDKKIAGRRDELKIDPNELGVPVTTDVDTLRELLRAVDGRCAVFCTYHSQDLLAGALPRGFAFDFGLFDEAHRTAGPRNRPFAGVLQDEQVPIKKRLFLTATPRYFAADETPSLTPYSMDDERVYGARAYELPLPVAIDRGIVCDYEIVAPLVTGLEVQQALRRAKQLLLPQKRLPLELVAAQIAVARAAEATGARRIVTFHQTVQESAAFAKDRLKIFQAAGIVAFHINGEMPTEQRGAVIDAFRAMEGSAVLSNCRCLSEGVDVPDIDMIVLNGKRESNEDLMQILGRALRLSAGKDRGFVVLPVFVDENESMESALKRSEMEITWELLHEALESGMVLPERVTEFRSGPSEDSPVLNSKSSHLRLVAPDGLLEDMKSAIHVRWVARLSERWDVMIGLAEEYAAREGNLEVPSEHLEREFPLGQWIHRQRRLYRKKRLPTSRAEQLVKLGIIWNSRETRWATGIAEAQSYFRQHGTLNLSRGDASDSLKSWLRKTQHSLNAGNLAAWRVQILKELGIEPIVKVSKTTLELFREWRETHPEGRPTRSGPDKLLAYRLKDVIARHAKGQVDATTVGQFKELGFDLDAIKRKGQTHYQRFGEQSWDIHYEALKSYVAENGWTGLWLRNRYKGLNISAWVVYQRYQQRHGTLSAFRKEKLDALGIEWARKMAWLAPTVDKLAQFRQEHGHQRFPRTREYEALHRQVRNLRKRIAAGTLPPDLEKRLDEIGFVRNVEDEYWEEGMHLLHKWVADHGTAPVGANLPGALSRFLRVVREQHRRDALTEHRVTELRSLGVELITLEDTHTEMMARLRRLATQYGKPNVEAMVLRDAELTQWVQTQVQAAARDDLTEAAATALRRVGIDVQEFSTGGLRDTG